jgi:hypothetical protein
VNDAFTKMAWTTIDFAKNTQLPTLFVVLQHPYHPSQGYLASEVVGFLACHPSNVSRALQKNDEVDRLKQV